MVVGFSMSRAMHSSDQISSVALYKNGYAVATLVCPSSNPVLIVPARSGRHRHLGKPDPVGTADWNNVVVEIIGRIVEACRIAIADEDKGARTFLQHIGE